MRFGYLRLYLYILFQEGNTQCYSYTLCYRRAKLGQIQGGLQRAIQDSTKGGCNNFLLLRVKNITFWSFYAKRLKKAYF